MRKRLISFDWAIKKILRNKANFEILEGFLSELIAPEKDLKIIKLLESESNRDRANEKSNRVDILAELAPGDLVLIEVQVDCELDFLHRILFGTSKIITEYLAKQQAYAKIKKVYSVNILYFDLGQGSDYIYKGTTEFIGVHNKEVLQLSNRQKHIYQKELISEIYPEYYLIKVNNFDDLAHNTLDEWIYFLKNEEIKSDFHAKGLLRAKRELDILNLSDHERDDYERYQDDLHYQASMIESGYHEGRLDGFEKGQQEGFEKGRKKGMGKGLKQGLEQGLQQGIQEGLEKGKQTRALEIAKNMLNANVSLESISDFTGLTITEITEQVNKTFN